MQELFNSIVTWLQLEFTGEVGLFLVVVIIAILSAFASGVLNELRKDTKANRYLANLELVKDMALNFIVTASDLSYEQLEEYRLLAEEQGLNDLDPRMVYVLVRLERAIENRSAIEFDILELRSLVERVYNSWKTE